MAIDTNNPPAPFDPELEKTAKKRIEARSHRRALAINAVDTARAHAGRHDGGWTLPDSDTVIAIMDLLDRVADSM
jgi:hypothetical protein